MKLHQLQMEEGNYRGLLLKLNRIQCHFNEFKFHYEDKIRFQDNWSVKVAVTIFSRRIDRYQNKLFDLWPKHADDYELSQEIYTALHTEVIDMAEEALMNRYQIGWQGQSVSFVPYPHIYSCTCVNWHDFWPTHTTDPIQFHRKAPKRRHSII